MNERLEQLKKQAVDYAEEVFVYHGKDYREIVMEKFAELIVRECATIADRERPNLLGCGYVTKTKGMLIKEHFGVKE